MTFLVNLFSRRRYRLVGLTAAGRPNRLARNAHIRPRHLPRLCHGVFGRHARRSALNAGDLEKLTAAVSRHVTFAEGADEAVASRAVAERLMKLFERLGRFSDAEMLKASAIW